MKKNSPEIQQKNNPETHILASVENSNFNTTTLNPPPSLIEYIPLLPLDEKVTIRIVQSKPTLQTTKNPFANLFRKTWIHSFDDHWIVCPECSSAEIPPHKKEPCAVCNEVKNLYKDSTESYKNGNRQKSLMLDRTARILKATEYIIYQYITYPPNTIPEIKLLILDPNSHSRILHSFIWSQSHKKTKKQQEVLFHLQRILCVGEQVKDYPHTYIIHIDYDVPLLPLELEVTPKDLYQEPLLSELNFNTTQHFVDYFLPLAFQKTSQTV